ncbi:hypothetical protein KDL44_04730 [bacterium]|nr:hypothetical protein [bacterium]
MELQHDENGAALYYAQLLKRWDFEELLAQLRRHPVMRGETDDSFIVAREYFAQA